MKKANRCWSDQSLLQEAAKENATPEILQVRKLNRQLYVKPPTPPPPPPPKPKMDQSLVNNLRSNHGRRVRPINVLCVSLPYVVIAFDARASLKAET